MSSKVEKGNWIDMGNGVSVRLVVSNEKPFDSHYEVKREPYSPFDFKEYISHSLVYGILVFLGVLVLNRTPLYDVVNDTFAMFSGALFGVLSFLGYYYADKFNHDRNVRWLNHWFATHKHVEYKEKD